MFLSSPIPVFQQSCFQQALPQASHLHTHTSPHSPYQNALTTHTQPHTTHTFTQVATVKKKKEKKSAL